VRTTKIGMGMGMGMGMVAPVVRVVKSYLWSGEYCLQVRWIVLML